MKKFFLLIGLFLAAFPALAQNKSVTAALTYGTPSIVLTGGKYEVLGLKFINATTTNSTLKFYDAATAITNVVRSAYTSYASYATNFSTTFTNTAGIVVTNTWSGMYRAATSNSAVTNERPKILGPFAVPGSATTTIDEVAASPALGLVVLSDLASGTLEVTYRETNP